jgi:hypothetical protein
MSCQNSLHAMHHSFITNVAKNLARKANVRCTFPPCEGPYGLRVEFDDPKPARDELDRFARDGDFRPRGFNGAGSVG